MQLDENTSRYMKKASSQIEGMTCALSTYIENTIDIVIEYHYRVYNELLNAIRSRHIDAIIQIRDVFRSMSYSIISSVERICASSFAKNSLQDEVQDFEECLSRLVIHCQSIQECNCSTENPYIPNTNDEIYQLFSGYRRILSEYMLESPAEDDIVSSIIYSFYKEVMNIYDNLFSEYDRMIKGIGIELQERSGKIEDREQRKALGVVKKRKLAENIGKAAVDATIGIIGGIRKKEVFSIADAGLGLIKTISEELEEVLPKESLARKSLKRIESFGKSMDLIGGLGVQENFDHNTAGALKLIGAVMGVSKFNQLNKDEKLDSIVYTAETTSAVISCVGSAISGKPLKALSQLPKAADKTMNLIESMAKYYHENDVHELPKCIDTKMHNLAIKIKEHEREVDEYKAKLVRGIPVRKPKAPPWIQIHQGISFTSDKIETILKIVEVTNNDIIAEIL